MLLLTVKMPEKNLVHGGQFITANSLQVQFQCHQFPQKQCDAKEISM
jgi:hypothetical protein